MTVRNNSRQKHHSLSGVDTIQNVMWCGNVNLCYRKEDSASVVHRSVVRCKRHIDTLNRLGVDHECDGRMDGQTDSP